MNKLEWQHLIFLMTKLDKNDQTESFLNLFLTASERDALSTRYQIIKALLKGDKTQRVIAKELKVSIAKITRGSNFLKTLKDEELAFLKSTLLEKNHD